jgi:membrane-bound metal-dependent hydrolase YbcI (DUF457 family)
MPSALFHAAIGILIGMAMLGDALDTKALAIIAFAGLLPDVDLLLAVWFPGAHRVYLHNIFVVLFPAALLLVGRRTGHMAWLKTRWPDVETVLWTAILVVGVAGIGIDAVATGVNPLYPVHDQFYRVQGQVIYSSDRSVQETVTDIRAERIGSTRDVYYASGVPPVSDGTAQQSWRIPLFGNTLQLLLSLTVFLIIGYRLQHRRDGLRIARYFPVTPIRQTERR